MLTVEEELPAWDSLSTALRSMNEVAVADELSEFINDCISN